MSRSVLVEELDGFNLGTGHFGTTSSHLILGERSRVLFRSSLLPLQGTFGEGGIRCCLGSRPPCCLPGAEGTMRVGGRCQVGGRRGLDISCDTEYGDRVCTPFSPAGRGCGARRPAAHLPTPQQRLAQVPLPPSPPPGSEGRRGKEATSGRGLTGRCRPRSPRAALSDRPGNRGPIPPAGARHGAPRARALRGRDASLPPSRGTLRPAARGHEPFGGTRRGLPAREGLPQPGR